MRHELRRSRPRPINQPAHTIPFDSVSQSPSPSKVLKRTAPTLDHEGIPLAKHARLGSKMHHPSGSGDGHPMYAEFSGRLRSTRPKCDSPSAESLPETTLPRMHSPEAARRVLPSPTSGSLTPRRSYHDPMSDAKAAPTSATWTHQADRQQQAMMKAMALRSVHGEHPAASASAPRDGKA